MTPALIILAALVSVGLVLYVHDRLTRRPEAEQAEEAAAESAAEEPDQCCGRHAVCEKFGDPLTDELYYDDEELAAYAGRPADSYTDDEAAAFREVMTTLQPGEYLSWGRAMERRGINLPSDVRDELILLISEQVNS